MKATVTVCLLIATYLCCYGQSIILVPQEHQTIQAALNSANAGDSIIVSPGVYTETITWPMATDSIVLQSTDGPHCTVVDANHNGRPLSIVGDGFFDDEESLGSATVVDGFTFRNGFTDEASVNGGGVSIFRASPALKNLIIEGNHISSMRADGGGLFLGESNSSIINCIIRENTMTSDGWANGAGIHIDESQINMINCTIANNVNESEKWSYGGGIFVRESSVRMDRTTIVGNTTNGQGWSYGAGIYLDNWLDVVVVNLTGCLVKDNRPLGTRPYGSAIYSNDDVLLGLANTIITGNGPATSTLHLDEQTVSMNHCTMAYNGAGIDCRGTNLTVNNSILWDNEYLVETNDWQVASGIKIEYSTVDGGFIGEGNIDADPRFSSAGILIPSKSSPCIASADADSSLPVDYYAQPRSLPTSTNPDMGAYEVNQSPSTVLTQFYVDENLNGIRDSEEERSAAGAIIINGDQHVKNPGLNGILTEVTSDQMTISYDALGSPNWNLTSAQSTYTLALDTVPTTDTISYGIHPANSDSDLSVTMQGSPIYCGESAMIKAIVTNHGTTTESGILWVSIDSLAKEVSAAGQPFYQGENKAAWQYTDIKPGKSIERFITFKAPDMLISITGQQVRLAAEVRTTDNDIILASTLTRSPLTCKPIHNSMAVTPHRADSSIGVDETVTYTISFHNPSARVVKDIAITNALDENLDHATFQLVHCSHPSKITYTLTDSGIVEFHLRDIYLADAATANNLNYGFITYSILPESSIGDSTIVHNRASGTLDGMLPFSTNTATSIVRHELAVSTYQAHTYQESVVAFPNPSNGIVSFDREVESIEVFSYTGVHMLSATNVRMLDLQPYPSGTYIAKITSGRLHQSLIVVLAK